MTTPDTPTLADTIRQLDEEGTPGPWEAMGDYRGTFEVTAGNGGCGVFLERTTILARSDMNDPCGEEADAALIVTLRNHAAEIADALEGVQRVRDYLALDMHDGECHSLRPYFTAIGPEVCNCTHGNVRRALDGE